MDAGHESGAHRHSPQGPRRNSVLDDDIMVAMLAPRFRPSSGGSQYDKAGEAAHRGSTSRDLAVEHGAEAEGEGLLVRGGSTVVDSEAGQALSSNAEHASGGEIDINDIPDDERERLERMYVMLRWSKKYRRALASRANQQWQAQMDEEDSSSSPSGSNASCMQPSSNGVSSRAQEARALGNESSEHNRGPNETMLNAIGRNGIISGQRESEDYDGVLAGRESGHEPVRYPGLPRGGRSKGGMLDLGEIDQALKTLDENDNNNLDRNTGIRNHSTMDSPGENSLTDMIPGPAAYGHGGSETIGSDGDLVVHTRPPLLRSKNSDVSTLLTDPKVDNASRRRDQFHPPSKEGPKFEDEYSGEGGAKRADVEQSLLSLNHAQIPGGSGDRPPLPTSDRPALATPSHNVNSLVKSDPHFAQYSSHSLSSGVQNNTSSTTSPRSLSPILSSRINGLRKDSSSYHSTKVSRPPPIPQSTNSVLPHIGNSSSSSSSSSSLTGPDNESSNDRNNSSLSLNQLTVPESEDPYLTDEGTLTNNSSAFSSKRGSIAGLPISLINQQRLVTRQSNIGTSPRASTTSNNSQTVYIHTPPSSDAVPMKSALAPSCRRLSDAGLHAVQKTPSAFSLLSDDSISSSQDEVERIGGRDSTGSKFRVSFAESVITIPIPAENSSANDDSDNEVGLFDEELESDLDKYEGHYSSSEEEDDDDLEEPDTVGASLIGSSLAQRRRMPVRGKSIYQATSSSLGMFSNSAHMLDVSDEENESVDYSGDENRLITETVVNTRVRSRPRPRRSRTTYEDATSSSSLTATGGIAVPAGTAAAHSSDETERNRIIYESPQSCSPGMFYREEFLNNINIRQQAQHHELSIHRSRPNSMMKMNSEDTIVMANEPIPEEPADTVDESMMASLTKKKHISFFKTNEVSTLSSAMHAEDEISLQKQNVTFKSKFVSYTMSKLMGKTHLVSGNSTGTHDTDPVPAAVEASDDQTRTTTV